MTEDLLHFIWKMKLLRPIPLSTTNDLPLKIVHTGDHNHHSGPDFTNGRIVLNGIDWTGNIEIHKRSSEWEEHGHQHDKAYDNVVLHVVYEHDKEVFNSMRQILPCLELKPYIEQDLLEKYETLYKNRQEIPCGNAFSACDDVYREPWLDRMLIERLEGKTTFIREVFEGNRNNWEETFYLLLCRNFGFKVNADPFLHLGRITPLHILRRHTDKPLQLEALLLGQAGLLEQEQQESYACKLQKEYAFLRHKYQLHPMNAQSWKFMRMRPANFPTIRIAQLAAFFQQYQHAFSRIIEAKDITDIIQLFELSASEWWDGHYTLTRVSPKVRKRLGKASIQNILINTVCPLLFFYGRERQNEEIAEKAIAWYSELSPEDNLITRLYEEEASFKTQHAAHSQALIQLHGNYCSKKRCLHCAIGAQALKPARPIEI